MKALAVTWQTAWREAWANRRGFWTQVTAMVINDVVWIVFWVLFFHRVGTVRGWNVDQLLVLLAVLTTSAGVVLGLLNNARRVGELASTGGLDAALSLPSPTLLHLLCRRIDTSNVGDLIFGIVLFFVRCNPTPQRTADFAFGVLCATLIITGFLVLMGSLSFFAGRNEAGDLGFHALLLFSSYPVDIFAGATKVFLYAVVPAGFVSASPARLIDHFDLARAMEIFGIGVAFVGAGAFAFALGLRRYTSGAIWTRA